MFRYVASGDQHQEAAHNGTELTEPGISKLTIPT
jgi:hypothetical protein